ncbi:MAG TPA: GNAT family N-acetyltransferase [Actinomycetota bacterium]
MTDDLLRSIDAYLDGIARAATRAEAIGPFTLFVRETPGWPYYARPTPGATGFTLADVEAVRARQRALGIPETFELVVDLSPGATEAIAATGLPVTSRPLMAMTASAFRPVPLPEGASIRWPDADDPDLARMMVVQELGFGAPGTEVGDAGAREREDALPRLDRDRLDSARRMIAANRTVTASLFLDGGPVATGAHQPLDGATEVVGVATLPAYRRRGLAAALTSALVEDALARGVTLVCLSAGDEDVARVYERVGFRRVGTFADAEPRDQPEGQ